MMAGTAVAIRGLISDKAGFCIAVIHNDETTCLHCSCDDRLDDDVYWTH